MQEASNQLRQAMSELNRNRYYNRAYELFTDEVGPLAIAMSGSGARMGVYLTTGREAAETDSIGALLDRVVEDGPAEQAGLQGRDETLDVDSEGFLIGGDIITAINNQPVHDMNDLITYLVKETEPGDKVDLDVISADGSQETVEVTLGVRPPAVTFRATNE